MDSLPFKNSKALKVFAIAAAVPVGLAAGYTLVSHALWHRSNMSTFSEAALRTSGAKKKYDDAVEFENLLLERAEANETKYQLPSLFSPHVGVNEEEIAGMQTFLLNRRAINDRAVIYLHGGTYVNRPRLEHWHMLDLVAKKTRAEIIVPMYPLAPVHSFEEAYTALDELWTKTVEKYGADNITLMGDGAGGGLAAGFAMKLAEEGREQPSRLILISPIVDLTFRNPDIRKLEAKDPLVAVGGLQKAAQLWSRGTELTDYRVSPAFGDVRGFKRVAIFVGTREIHYPDVKLFYDRIHALGIRSELNLGTGLNHSYPLFPIPEATKAIEHIATIITED